ncbi:hypothetical protein [Lutibacter sp.]|uniref:hypothetical protein n=1 Tax=Lutibacter sp. TaxID=1925666 RepID=UPI003563BB41
MVKKIIVVFTTLFITFNGFAQKNNSSAYSFFGIGDISSSNTVEQLSMGGAGVSLNDNLHLNLSNPASLSSLKFTTYTLGLENNNLSVKESDISQKAATTYLSYLALGVPLGEKGGLGFGLMPYSSVGYSLTSNVYVDDELTEITLYNGEGGTNKVYLAVGFEIFKGFSVGVQGNYLFGKIDNSVVNQIKGVSRATKYQTISNLESFSLNTGFQYKKELKNNLNLHFGGNVNLENEITSDGNKYLYSVSIGNYEIPRDTILNEESNGKIIAPLKSSLGIGVGKENKWYASLDYNFQKALKLDGNVLNNYSKIKYDNSNKIALGGFFIPKYNSITSYWDRVTYRAGIKLEKTGLLVNGSGIENDFTAIDDYGISFGVGLPVSNQLSNLNIGFEFGKRGETEKGLVQENYFNFRLSLSLNDKWFRKLEIF